FGDRRHVEERPREPACEYGAGSREKEQECAGKKTGPLEIVTRRFEYESTRIPHPHVPRRAVDRCTGADPTRAILAPHLAREASAHRGRWWAYTAAEVGPVVGAWWAEPEFGARAEKFMQDGRRADRDLSEPSQIADRAGIAIADLAYEREVRESIALGEFGNPRALRRG